MLTARRRPSSRLTGLTLVELMVALAIFMIALMALLPEAISWVQGLGVRNMGESMRSGIEKTRLEALRRNANMTFWLVTSGEDKPLDAGCQLSANGTSWVISVNSPEGDCMAAPSTTVQPLLVERWSGSEGGRKLAVAGVDVNGNATSSVTFNALGQVLGTGSQLNVVDISHASSTSARRLRVLIQAGGSVRLCDRDVAADDPRSC